MTSQAEASGSNIPGPLSLDLKVPTGPFISKIIFICFIQSMIVLSRLEVEIHINETMHSW